MVCVNCGKTAGDGEFCISCGVKLDIQKQAEQSRTQEHIQRASALGGKSTFSATGLQVLGMFLLAYILCLITFTLALPWVICIEAEYFAPKITLSGRQVKFTGKGSELLPIYLMGVLFTILTLGIYSFWMIKNIYKYIIEHTELY